MLSVLKGSESAARRAVRQLMSEGPCSAQNTSVLLAGPSGSPVEELADELLRFWMCPKKPEGAPYCGECTVCRTLQTRQAIDLLIIEPIGGQVIKIEQLLERPTTDKNAENRTPMNVFVRTRPLQAAKKVVWLRGVDRVTDQNANTLLKALEEPMPHVRYLLTTAEPSKLLPTIRSRCLTLFCAQETLEEELGRMESIFCGGSAPALNFIRKHAAGHDALFEFFESLPASGPGSALKLAENFRKRCEKLGHEGRDGLTHGLQLLGYWARATGICPDTCLAIAECHRRVLGYASATYATDSLFLTLVRDI